MNVLMVEPGKAPYETEIGDDLEAMQAAVGGNIQAVYPYEDLVGILLLRRCAGVPRYSTRSQKSSKTEV